MIVTFYSFKGGVGRSMALVNVGEILAAAGREVILCDWDLEAPGLEGYVTDDPAEAEALGSAPGIMDLLLEYKLAMTEPSPESATTQPDFARVGDLSIRRPYSYARLVSPGSRSDGMLRLLTAGRRDDDHARRYAEAVQTFDWSDFYTEWAGASYLEFWRRDLVGDDRIVLIDSRTGVTEQGGVCTHHLADVVVLMSAANDLNLSGTRWMADVLSSPDLAEFRAGRPLTVVPVASRIEQSAQRDELNDFRKELLVGLGDRLPPELGDPQKFLRAAEIPYKPYYSFKERIAAREGEGVRDEHLYAAYRAIADAVVTLGSAARGDGARAASPGAAIPAEIERVLESHARWLESGRASGRRADLMDADLSRRDLSGRRLAAAVLDGANLRGARLADADLSDASLLRVDASLADFRSARLERALLDDAVLTGARMTQANLERASLPRASMTTADLRHANLRGASLEAADLSQAKLEGASFIGADLRAADLRQAAGLDAEQLSRADCGGARLPEGVSSDERAGALRSALEGPRGLAVWSLLVAAGSLAFFLGRRGAFFEPDLIASVSGMTVFGLAVGTAFGLYLAAMYGVRGNLARAFVLPAVFSDGTSAPMRIAPWLPHDAARPQGGSGAGTAKRQALAAGAIFLYGAPALLTLVVLYSGVSQYYAGTAGAGLLAAAAWAAGVGIRAQTRELGRCPARGGAGTPPRRAALRAFAVAGVAIVGAGLLVARLTDDARLLMRTSEYGVTAVHAAGDAFAVHADSLYVFDAATGDRRFSTPLPYPTRPAISPDGQRIMTIAEAGGAWVRSVQSGEVLAVFDSTRTLRDAAFSPGGRSVATVRQDGTIAIWDAQIVAPPVVFGDTASPITRVAFGAERSVLTAASDASIRIWDLVTGSATPVEGRLVEPGIGPGGRLFATSDSFTVIVRDAEDPLQPLDTLPDAESRHLWFHPDGGAFAYATRKGTLALWQAGEARAVPLGDEPWGVVDVALRPARAAGAVQAAPSPAARTMLAADADGTAWLADVETGARGRTLYAHRGGVTLVTFGSDGTRALTAGVNGEVKLWTIGAAPAPDRAGAGNERR